MGTQNSAEKKRNWLNACFNNSAEHLTPLNKEKVIAQFCVTNVSTRKTALELLKQFIALERIYEDNGNLLVVGVKYSENIEN